MPKRELEIMEKFRNLLKACRLPFLTATIVPVAYGSALAFYGGRFDLVLFLWTMTGSLFLHTGTNLINNYFDYYNGSDCLVVERTPYSGGTNVIVEGKVKPKEVAILSFTCYLLGIIIGLYLALLRGRIIIYLGLLGLVLSYFYSAPPLQLISRGLGELTVGLCFGPLLVVGAYYVQTCLLSWTVFAAGIPLGFLIAAVLYVNQFPDYHGDRAANKCNWVVRLGREEAVKGYYVLIILAYLSMGVQIGLRTIPLTALVGFLTIPLAIKACLIISQNFNQIRPLIPCLAATVGIHLLTGSLLVVSLVVAYLLKV